MNKLRFALIKAGFVVNVVVALDGWEAPVGYDVARVPDGMPVGPGWAWNGVDFAEPAPQAVEEIVLSPIDFMRRFTFPEWAAIKAERGDDPVVDYVMTLFEVTPIVRLAHVDTAFGIGYFEHVGLLTPARAAAILSP